jgi:hypothetical protein
MVLLMLLAAAPVPELGIVQWQRGYDAAAARAKAEGKPLVVLFDEVPGCSTVLAFAEQVLSNPLVADALEREFVSVVVYNNVSGDDRAVLQRFGEPEWNNPVLRLFTPAGKQTARIDTGTLAQVASALVETLRASGRPVPGYLQLLLDETAAGATTTRTFAMGCFWEGEAALGGVEGVKKSETGFVGGREVVRLTVAEGSPVAEVAKARGYAEVKGEFRASPSDDDKHRLKASRFAQVPMTELQRSKVNADPVHGEQWLSPRQLARVRR